MCARWRTRGEKLAAQVVSVGSAMSEGRASMSVTGAPVSIVLTSLRIRRSHTLRDKTHATVRTFSEKQIDNEQKYKTRCARRCAVRVSGEEERRPHLKPFPSLAAATHRLSPWMKWALRTLPGDSCTRITAATRVSVSRKARAVVRHWAESWGQG